MERILLDTDIGSDIDDALALAYLLRQPRCELLGVTTVSGHPDLRAALCSALCRNAGKPDIPIHVGIDKPLLVDQKQPEAPQARALGPWPHADFDARCTAIEFLRETIRANPGEVTLLAIGPQTNIGVLFATDPEIPTLLKRLVFMAGSFLRENKGEWNVLCDPHASAIAYGVGGRPRPAELVSFGLDVTTRVRLQREEARAKLRSVAALAPVADFAEIWLERSERITFHDPLAAACIFEPDICAYRDGEVTVECADPEHRGWTEFRDADGDAAPHRIAVDVDAARFFEHYFSVVGGASA